MAPGVTSQLNRAAQSMITLHGRPIILWHEARTHCDCACVSSQWTLRQYIDQVPIQERVFNDVRAMLRTSSQWREAAVNNMLNAMIDPPAMELDRRNTAPERRSVVRGGRRSAEQSRYHLDTAALLAEVGKLREENALLRDASLTFGALAERLSKNEVPSDRSV